MVFAGGTLLPGCLVLKDMPRPVRLFWGGAIVVIAILGVVGTIVRLMLAKSARRRYETAVILVETGRAEQALPAIRTGKRYELNPAGRERWDALEMAAYVEMNDIAMMALQHHPSREWLQRGIDHFERLYAESERITRVMAISVHPYITGAPHRIRYLEQLYEHIQAHPGVLMWTGEQILDWYRHAAGLR